MKQTAQNASRFTIIGSIKLLMRHHALARKFSL
jgi:hypothetical protein